MAQCTVNLALVIILRFTVVVSVFDSTFTEPHVLQNLEYCQKLMDKHHIVFGKSWGSLLFPNRHIWRSRKCMELLTLATLNLTDTMDQNKTYHYSNTINTVPTGFKKQNIIVGKTNFSAALDWMRQNGAIFSNVTVGNTIDSGRGIFAKTNIQAQDVVATVPESLLLSLKNTANTNLGQIIAPFWQKADETLAPDNTKWHECDLLAIHVMCELNKGTKSFWHSYLNILPTKIPSPLSGNWNDLEMIFLKSSIMRFSTEHNQENIDKLFEKVYDNFLGNPSVVDKAKCLTLNNSQVQLDRAELKRLFLWSYLIIISRSWVQNWRNHGCMLVPFIDLFNMQEKANLVEFVTHRNLYAKTNIKYEQSKPSEVINKGFVLVRAYQNFNPEEQIFVSYGGTEAHCNMHLLQKYGFTLASSKRDCIHISLGVSSREFQKKDLLQLVNADENLIIRRDAPLPLEVITAFRILALTPNEITSTNMSCLVSDINSKRDIRKEKTKVLSTKYKYFANEDNGNIFSLTNESKALEILVNTLSSLTIAEHAGPTTRNNFTDQSILSIVNDMIEKIETLNVDAKNMKSHFGAVNLYNIRNVLIVRIGERHVIQSLLDEIQIYLGDMINQATNTSYDTESIDEVFGGALQRCRIKSTCHSIDSSICDIK